ncbi:hypothetical protein C1I98_32805, partial [Spongiactinospora gelatinilytica]
MGSMGRALLFLDVDEPLIPFGAPPPGGYPSFPAARTLANPLLDRIDPAHGARLAALPYELVWATTWLDDANDCVAPLLGLPPLPVVRWPEASGPSGPDEVAGMHWKTPALVEWAAGRPFAWVDDEVGDADREWVSAYHPGGALPHRV